MKTLKPNLSELIAKLLVFNILLTYALSANAQYERSESPYFFVLSSNPAVDQLPLKSTSAEVNITGVIADVTVTQQYQNTGENPLEAVYTFPASSRAAIYAMEMVIGERKIVANIEEKQKAREQYDQAKAEGKRASLLEQQRPNVFQMNVANIMPGDAINVTLRYTELLVPEEGTYRFIYPTVVGPRYPGEGTGSGNAFVSSPYTKEGVVPAYILNMDVKLSMGMPIQHVACNTHKVVTSFPSSGNAQVALASSEQHAGNRDFVLEYKLAGNTIESGLMLYEHGDENFFLLMVQPPKRIVKEELPPREYIFIVDVSGSMHGFPINTSKVLLRNLIVNLRPTDRFNVLLFESGAYWLADESLPAVDENIKKATDFLSQQHGYGETNLLAAMKKAMRFPRHHEGLSRSFIVVTDGYVNVEKEVFDIIRNKSDEANTFAFGIGSSVNRYILEGMAHVGMSEPFIVLNPESADAEAEKFRKYINSPVLTQIKKSFSGFEVYDVEPISIPDVLAERPVILYGKYRGKPQGSVTIEGYAGNKKYKKTFKVSDVHPDKNHSGIRYLWARKRIQLLDDYARIHNSGNTQQEVTQLGLKYNLMTAYTSFVAIEEKPVNHGRSFETVKQPLPLPLGVENSAVGFDMEIDEDDLTFSFHQEIVLPDYLVGTTRQKIVAHIEKNMMAVVNQYLTDNEITLDFIEVFVSMNGNVTNAIVGGEHVTKEMREDLIKILKKYQFSEFGVLRMWNFTIRF